MCQNCGKDLLNTYMHRKMLTLELEVIDVSCLVNILVSTPSIGLLSGGPQPIHMNIDLGVFFPYA